jgi:hypothetical protein
LETQINSHSQALGLPLKRVLLETQISSHSQALETQISSHSQALGLPLKQVRLETQISSHSQALETQISSHSQALETIVYLVQHLLVRHLSLHLVLLVLQPLVRRLPQPLVPQAPLQPLVPQAPLQPLAPQAPLQPLAQQQLQVLVVQELHIPVRHCLELVELLELPLQFLDLQLLHLLLGV